MSVRPAMALLAGTLALTGCGALNPYPTLPHPTTAGQPAGTRVAICYNGLKTSQEAAREAAQQECPAGTTAESLDSDYILQYCPLLLPLRETFVCTQKAK